MSTQDDNDSFDTEFGLLFVTADRLAPLFLYGTMSQSDARAIAMDAVTAYSPETRADYFNVARTIAFSMAGVALLGKTAGTDMSLKDKMRTYDRANALHRSANQAERTMILRHRPGKAKPQPEAPTRAESKPQTAPTPQSQRAELGPEFEAIMEAVEETLVIQRAQNPQPAPAQAAKPARPPAITVTNFPAGALGSVQSKEALLSQTAMSSVMTATSAQHHAGLR